MIDNYIVFYEELSMNAQPALKTQLYDGWVLRFSNGYTNRANSVNPIYTSLLPVEEKVAFCEDIYTRQGLPTVFKLTDAAPAELENYLDTQDYEIVTPTYLLENDTLPSSSASGNVTVFYSINPIWRDHCLRLNGLIDTQKAATAVAMMANILTDVVCAQIEADGKVIACGLCIVERGYAGLYDIVVDPEYRQKGCGTELCRALLSEAVRLGAKSAYLQVVADNTSAIALYKKLGYKHRYKYWYRVKDRRRTQ